MMYPYSTLADETLITHSHLIEDNGLKVVEIHFERPTDNGFDTIRFRLPTYEIVMRDGHYSDNEIAIFERMCRDGAHIFYKYAELGGSDVANAI